MQDCIYWENLCVLFFQESTSKLEFNRLYKHQPYIVADKLRTDMFWSHDRFQQNPCSHKNKCIANDCLHLFTVTSPCNEHHGKTSALAFFSLGILDFVLFFFHTLCVCTRTCWKYSSKFKEKIPCKFWNFGSNKVIATQLYRDCHAITKYLPKILTIFLSLSLFLNDLLNLVDKIDS